MPAEPFLKWLHRADSTSAVLRLADLRREPTIYLPPPYDTEEEALSHLAEVCGKSSKSNSTDGTVFFLNYDGQRIRESLADVFSVPERNQPVRLTQAAVIELDADGRVRSKT
jgi:hypothetical protein